MCQIEFRQNLYMSKVHASSKYLKFYLLSGQHSEIPLRILRVSIIIENLLNKWRSLTENFQVSLVSGLKCICILIVSPSIYNFIIL